MRLEQAPLEGFVQPGDHRLAFVSGIPIPAEIEEADPVFERPFDLPVHDLHLGVIVIAEGGFAVGIGIQQAPAPARAGHPAGIKHRSHFDVARVGLDGWWDSIGFRRVCQRGIKRAVQLDGHGRDPPALHFELKNMIAGFFRLDLPCEGRRGILFRHLARHSVGRDKRSVNVAPCPGGDLALDGIKNLDSLRRDQFDIGRKRGIARVRELEADGFRTSGAQNGAVPECGRSHRIIQQWHLVFHGCECDLLKPEFRVAREADDIAEDFDF